MVACLLAALSLDFKPKRGAPNRLLGQEKGNGYYPSSLTVRYKAKTELNLVKAEHNFVEVE